MTKKLLNPTPVGRAGSVFLLAQAGDLAGGDLNGPAQTHDLRLDLLSEIKPLQVWFKWGVFEPTDQAEYEQALAQVAEKRYNPDQPRDPAGTSTGGQWSPEGGAGSSPAGSVGLTGPEVRARLEELKDYRLDDESRLVKEALQMERDLAGIAQQQTSAGIFDSSEAKGIREAQKAAIATRWNEVNEVMNERRRMTAEWIMAENPGTGAMEFADAITDEQRAKIIAAFDQFYALVGSKATGEILVTPTKTGRSRYVPGDGSGREAGKPELSIAGNFRSVIHELGHHFEHTAPGVMEDAIAFWRRRTETDVPVPLATIAPDRDYDRREITHPDSFFDPYVGKVYRDAKNNIVSTEIVSMGIEAMWADPPKFAKADPDHFDLIWRLMRS